MMDSIAKGDLVMLAGTVVAIVGGQVVVEIEGEALTVSPKQVYPPIGGGLTFEVARRKGVRAREAGESIAACPYADTKRGQPYRRAWIKGWMEGQE